VRRLNPDLAILIPERQNPLLVHRIVYFQDPTFRKLFEAQKGTLPYPSKDGASVQVLTERLEALERRVAERVVVDFVRPEKAKAVAPVEPEPKLAAEIVVREEVLQDAAQAESESEVALTAGPLEAVAEPEVGLDALKPPATISVARMNKFTLSLQAQEA
jgi:type IV secretion system protein VirD4